jgi:hypothetical protein
MDKVGILCEKDRNMLYEFSRRSIDGLKERAIVSLTLSFFSTYMDANVKKEVEKDRLIIEEAATAFEAGRPVCDLDLEDIFEKTKKIDKTFLDSLAIPSFAMTVHYSDFADIRIRRIWRIARTVYVLLEKWPAPASFTDAVRNSYTEKEFKDILVEILHLYNLETRMLGDAIRSPFHTAIISYLESLFESMESVIEDLADTYTRNIFGDVYA